MPEGTLGIEWQLVDKKGTVMLVIEAGPEVLAGQKLDIFDTAARGKPCKLRRSIRCRTKFRLPCSLRSKLAVI